MRLTNWEEFMKKNILISLMALLLLAGCSKEHNITFEAQIQSISDKSIMVSTKDDEVGFDKASVGMSTAKIEGDLTVGKKVNITIQPEIRESYPVQVTALKVEVIGETYQKITAEEAKEMIDKGEYGILLDVRATEEYNEGHIEGATLLPDYEIKDKAETILYDKEEVILVYCKSGRRSEAAAKQLMDMGYINVYDVGGIMDWPYEIVKE